MEENARMGRIRLGWASRSVERLLERQAYVQWRIYTRLCGLQPPNDLIYY
jgi:hypothetical protein